MKRLIFLLGLVSHASGALEWAGTFDVTSYSTLKWSAQADSTGAYPDADMKIIIVPGNPAFELTGNAPGLTETVLKLGTEGFAASNEPCTVVNNGGTIPISTSDPPACFKLVFDTTLTDNLFTIETTQGSPDGTRTEQITKVNSIAIFAQHFPTEFERDAHYLKALDGTDIEPVQQKSGSSLTLPFEWAGTFDVSSASSFRWLAQADSTGAYPDADMKIIIIPGNPTFSLTGNAPGSTHTVQALGVEGFADTNPPCTVVNNGGIIPMSTGDPPACFKLVFDTSLTDNSFTIETARDHQGQQITKVNSIAIFAQHVPTEFERDAHYLKDLAGTDIEPITQQPEPGAGAHDHDHGGGHGGGTTPAGPFEWAGTFDVTAHNIMTWTAQTKPDKYPFNTMKIILVPGNPAFTLTGNAPGHNEPVMQLGTEGFGGTCTNIPNGATIPISTGDPPACYKILFDSKLHTSVFSIDTTLGSPDGIRTERITKVNSIAVFGEHYPIEFERDAHYLKGVDGSDIEPVEEHPPKPPGPGKRWGAAIGAAFLVMACTLIGVFFIAPMFVSLRESHESMVNTLASAFAAGALIAAAFFLMLYEATHLIEIKEGVRTEAEASAWWGSAVLLGLVTPFIIDSFVVVIKGEASSEAAEAAVQPAPEKAAEDAEKAGAGGGQVVRVPSDADAAAANLNQNRVLMGVLIGDFLHNLVDGFFIGAAFTKCSTSMGWTISASTIYHELAQEISDYLVLTNPKMGGLNQYVALLLNFLSGSSVIMGVCIVMSSDPSNFDTGILLAYGAGVYVQIACCECFPRVHEHANTMMMRGAAFLLFCIGAIGIGLVLLDHEHCTGDGEHAHGH